ncbi:hypothetical protein C7H19_14935 [Aphanothece hegewaldii CCALA 016]|uniref:Uncharacterized protein n=1 Tax=Aphanothece hegewaldii CCALA 016 TaxID=2107694 RepID=A0A2T1LWA2_9CHRO|nr:hypothetical protein [Aphanothece hegewaldii]PSF36035.1 hypothetical protein C7H19_14935 [Aphanothece hegewaldii CCALA 016]
MTYINYHQMSRTELRAYILEHRDDEQAFQAYMDKLVDAPVLASGTLTDLDNPEKIAEIIKKIQKTKKEE